MSKRILLSSFGVALPFLVAISVWFFGEAPKAKDQPESLHVYVADGQGLIYLCATGMAVSGQVVQCLDGNVILLTAGLYEKVVMSTVKIGEKK
jgi:hypothetical protein